MACIGDETIAAMLEGGLGDDAGRRARGHIAECDACRRLVSAAIAEPADGATLPGYGRTQLAVGSQPRATGTVVAYAWGPGAVVAGRYTIERLLGEGGMGRVFAARQAGLERLVALKILQPELARDAQALKRFEREARLVAQLTSDEAVRVHDFGALETGEPFLVMELLDGEDLAQVLERGPVPIAEAIAWISSACEALAEAHALGVVHRDLKPSNLFVTRQGRLKVLDFGLAKLAAPASFSTASMTGVGAILGSPHYMAPEQIMGASQVDARADVWSLGATFYHLITGRPPFPQPTLEAVFACILGGAMPPLDALRPDLAAVIARALAHDPSARFQTVRELAAALNAQTPMPMPMPIYAPPPPVVSAAPASAAPAASRSVLVPVLATALVVTLGFVIAGAVYISRLSSPGTVAVTPPAPTSTSTPTPTPTPAGPAPTPTQWDWPAATAPVADEPPVAHGAGPLGNLDADRLRKRLEKLGWEVKETTKEELAGCVHTRLRGERPKDARQWADVFLLECSSRGLATSEGARLRKMGGWVIDDDRLVLDVGTNDTLGSDEAKSKALALALLEP